MDGTLALPYGGDRAVSIPFNATAGKEAPRGGWGVLVLLTLPCAVKGVRVPRKLQNKLKLYGSGTKSFMSLVCVDNLLALLILRLLASLE